MSVGVCRWSAVVVLQASEGAAVSCLSFPAGGGRESEAHAGGVGCACEVVVGGQRLSQRRISGRSFQRDMKHVQAMARWEACAAATSRSPDAAREAR